MTVSASDLATLPAHNGVVITKSNSDIFARPTRAVYVGGTGHMKVRFVGGQDNVLLSAIPAGSLLPIAIDKIYDTDTTATLMVALW